MEQKSFIYDLEEQQYENIYHENDVPLQDLSKPIITQLIYFGFGLFIIFAVAIHLIEISRELNSPFELKGGLKELSIQYPEKTYILETFVNTGQNVTKGTPLIAITSASIVSIIGEIEKWKKDLEIYNIKKTKVNRQTIDLFRIEIEGLEKIRKKLQQELEITKKAKATEMLYLQQQLNNQKKQHERNGLLHQEKVISEVDYEESLWKFQKIEQEWITLRESFDRDIAALYVDFQDVENNISLLKQEILKKTVDYELELAEIKKNIEMAERKLYLHFGNFKINENAIQLLSERAGKVTMISHNESEVPSGELLLRLQIDSAAYYAYSKITSKEIGKFKKGNRVVLKYESFPHYYYGTMEGEVVNISSSPDNSGNYGIEIELKEFGSLKSVMTKGMTGTASIIIEENTIANFLFRVFNEITTLH